MSAKGELIEEFRLRELGTPEFEVRVTGPDHEPIFNAEVYAQGERLAGGQGRTKREAERAASEAALRVLQAEDESDEDDVAEDEQNDDAPGAAWPIYAELLSQALLVAHERVPDEGSVDDVRRAAARLYTGLLGDLGVLPDDEDAEEPGGE